MSINVKPSRWMSPDDTTDHSRIGNTGELVPLIWGEDGSCMIECTAYNPESMERRKVYVYLDRQDVTDVLLQLRGRAISDRSTPMSSG